MYIGILLSIRYLDILIFRIFEFSPRYSIFRFFNHSTFQLLDFPIFNTCNSIFSIYRFTDFLSCFMLFTRSLVFCWQKRWQRFVHYDTFTVASKWAWWTILVTFFSRDFPDYVANYKSSWNWKRSWDQSTNMKRRNLLFILCLFSNIIFSGFVVVVGGEAEAFSSENEAEDCGITKASAGHLHLDKLPYLSIVG